MRLAVVVSVLLAASSAFAAPSSAERAHAKALYESGTTHYNLSEFADALKDFKEAYRLTKNPVLLFNIAQCQRQLKNYEEAVNLLRAYRREYVDAPNRDEVDRLIKQLDDAIAERRNQQPPTGMMPIASPPAEHAEPAHVEPTQAAPAAATLTAAPPEKAPEKPAKKRAWVWGVVAAVGVAVVVGVTVGVVVGTGASNPPPKLPDVRF